MDRFSGDGSMFGKFGGVVIVTLSAAIIAGLILRPSPDELPAAMSLGVTPAASSSQLEPVIPVDETPATEAATDTAASTETTEKPSPADEVATDTTETASPEGDATETSKESNDTEATETPTADVDAMTEEEETTEAETTEAPASDDKPAQ